MSREWIPAEVERRVRQAARHRCGYCLSPQWLVMARLEIEHIIPVAKGGASTETDLWMSCPLCNQFPVSDPPLGHGGAPPRMPAVQQLAAVEMLVEAGHEERSCSVRDCDDEIVVGTKDPRLEIGAQREIATLCLVFAPRVRDSPDRAIPVFLDRHRATDDPQEVLETTRVLPQLLGVMPGEVSIGPCW
jgi:hypothetical protein